MFRGLYAGGCSCIGAISQAKYMSVYKSLCFLVCSKNFKENIKINNQKVSTNEQEEEINNFFSKF